MNGKIISLSGNKAKVLVNSSILDCSIRGKIKFTNNQKIVVGDNVNVIVVNGEYVIEEIKERKNALIRPNVSNIDCLFVIQSIIQPNFNMKLMMKFLAYYEYYIDNVEIYLTKYDLCDEKQKQEIHQIIQIFANDGYKIKIAYEEDKQMIRNNLANKVVCFAGNSGVGKSTFVNYLFPKLQIKTQSISFALNRGKHTTTTTKIYPIDKCYIVDTPGFSSIDIKLLTPLQLAHSYHDFKELSTNCKYSDCLHLLENGCAIKAAVEKEIINPIRYKYYCKLLKELVD